MSTPELLRLLREALQYTSHRVRVRPEVRKIELNPPPIELSSTRKLNDRATRQHVSSRGSSRAEVFVVRLACIVVSVKVAQVLQLLQAQAFRPLGARGESGWDTSPTTR